MDPRHKATGALLVLLLLANSAEAQQDQQQPIISSQVNSSPSPPPQLIPNQALSNQQKEEVREIAEDSIKNNAELDMRIRSIVNENFNWVIKLLGALIGVIGFIPIFAGVFVFLLRNAAVTELIYASEKKLNEIIHKKLKDKVEEQGEKELENQLKLFEKNINNKLSEFEAYLCNEKEKATKTKKKIIQEIKNTMPTQEGLFIDQAIHNSERQKTQQLLDSLNSEMAKLASFSPDDFITQGDAFYFKKNYEMAFASFNQATKGDPDSSKAWLGRGSALLSLLLNDLEIDREAPGVSEEEELVLWRKCPILSNDQYKQIDEVLSSLNLATKIEPDLFEAWFKKGSALSAVHRYKEAIESYEKVLEIKPDSYYTWLTKSSILKKLMRYTEAIEACDNAIKINSKRGSAWYNKSCYHSLNGDINLAQSALLEAIKCDCGFRNLAKKEPDFDAIRGEQWFKELVDGVELSNITKNGLLATIGEAKT